MNRLFIPFFLTLFCATFCSKTLAQMQVTAGSTPPFTTENLITNVFLGSGVEVTKVTFSGDSDAIGYFNNATAAIGIKRGLILTSGRVESGGGVVGTVETGADFASNTSTSNATDTDLAAQTTSPILDVQVYEIEFIPIADTLRFRYVFASEEYPEYPCTPFNDVFGFFISGPKPGGGMYDAVNIARVPTTGEPVTITNVRPANPSATNCPPKNVQFYNNNNNTNKQPVYDGFLDIFTAQAIVIPCSTYKIKIAIADAGDTAYDSAVFLEAKSFGTGSLKVEYAAVSLDGTITEGCSDATLTFSLPYVTTDTFDIDYTIFGTAQNGIDYEAIASNLTILPGDSSLVLNVKAFEDGVLEGSEFLAIDVRRDICNRDTFFVYLRDNGLLAPILPNDTFTCVGVPLVLDATLPIPQPPAPKFTQPNDLQVTPINTPLFSTMNVFGVQPFFLADGVIREVCVKLKHVWDDDIDAFLIAPDGRFMELTTDNGRNSNNLDICFRPVSTRPVQSINDTIYALFPPNGDVPGADQTTYFTGEWAPEGEWQDLWDGGSKTNGTWKLQLRDDQQGFIGTLDEWHIVFEPAYKINYEWSPPANLSCSECAVTTVNFLNAGEDFIYRVTATDSYGCKVVDSVIVDAFENLAAPTVFCASQNATSVVFEWLAVKGATGYEVSLDGQNWISPNGAGGLSHLFSGLAAGASIPLSVRATGACAALISIHVCENCTTPTVGFLADSTACFGSQDGSVQITANGSNPPFSFEMNGQSNQNGQFSGLLAGNYVATITDASGCAANKLVEIGEPPELKTTIQILQNAGCPGSSNGIAEALPTGGTSPFSFIWSAQNQTQKKATSLAAGQILVTVTDANGCSAMAVSTVLQSPPILLSMTSSPASCFQKADGLAMVSAVGGTGNFGYLWSDPLGQQTVTAFNLVAGSYSVTIFDSGGCSETASVSVSEPTELTASVAVGQTSCSGQPDGTATVSPTGGTAPYKFKWSGLPAQTTGSATNLQPILYKVTVTDANGCSILVDVNVAAPPALSASLIAQPTSCAGGSDGSAMASATGGSGGYTFLWSNGQTSAAATGFSAGPVSLTVTDSKGCTSTVATTIFEPTAMQIQPTATDISCFGKTDGALELAVVGGQMPFTFLWSNGQTTKKATGLEKGFFAATVSDFKGCTATILNLEIKEPVPILLTLTPTDVACFDQKTGSILAEKTGGTEPFSWNWAGPNAFSSLSQNPQNLASGIFDVTATDQKGCTSTAQIEVDQPNSPLSSDLLPLADFICFGQTSGEADVNASGGTAPFSFFWSNQATTKKVENLAAGDYFLTITDAAGCLFLDTTKIGETPEISAQLLIDAPLCAEGTDGSAEIQQIFYGNTPVSNVGFFYSWSTVPLQTTIKATALKAGETYFLTLTDGTGCTGIEQFSLPNPPPMFAEMESFSNAKCFGEATGSATAKGTGGTLPYGFLWSQNAASQNTEKAENLPAGVFFVSISDANGCFAVASASISQPSKIEIGFQKSDVKCFGESTGRAIAQVSGGSPSYLFEWQNGPQNSVFENLPSGLFPLTVSDQNGCRATALVEIKQPEKPLSVEAFAFETKCFGGHDGQIEIDAAGGTPPYLYGLDAGGFNGSDVQIGLEAGWYEGKVRDFNGCEQKAAGQEVKSRGPLEIDLGPDLTIVLGQSVDLNLTIIGAKPPVEIIWSAEDSLWLSCLDCRNPSVDSLFYQNTFEVLVIDSTGCSATDLITITVEKPRRVFVPTAFSPNGDAENDILSVLGQKQVKIIDFKVFDRWGEMVFEAKNFDINDVQFGWDGQFRGQPMESNVYVWTLEVEYIDFVREVFKGQTVLIR